MLMCVPMSLHAYTFLWLIPTHKGQQFYMQEYKCTCVHVLNSCCMFRHVHPPSGLCLVMTWKICCYRVAYMHHLEAWYTRENALACTSACVWACSCASTLLFQASACATTCECTHISMHCTSLVMQNGKKQSPLLPTFHAKARMHGCMLCVC